MGVLERDPKPIATIVEGEKQLSYFANYEPVGTAQGYEPEKWEKN